MATDRNPLDAIKSLLEENWIKSNTDSKIPIFAKKYEKPRSFKLNPNTDIIYVYSFPTLQASVGIGSNNLSEVTDVIKIDIRSRPQSNNLTDDSHARKVLAEVRRILAANVVEPATGWNIGDYWQDIDDLSDDYVGIFRYIAQVNLIAWCRDVST